MTTTIKTLLGAGYLLAASITLASCSADPTIETKASTDSNSCSDSPIALQVLGSGGPIADDHRAGASNILWVDGKARLLIDAGSGAFVRYGEAGVDFNDHDAILLTHLHGDHASGLPALLNNGAFAKRSADLMVAGPAGNDQFPSTSAYLSSLIGKEDGALRYLHPYLEDDDALPRLTANDINVGKTGLQTIWNEDGVRIDAIAVHHLDVPALAYVIRAKDKTVVLSGDQSFLSEDFVTILSDTKPDLLVMHNAITMADGQPRGLHRDPKSIGETAAALNAQTLLLTHHMQRALLVQDEVNAAISEDYSGPVLMADDLSCYPL
ncbi:MBL fold metallo-hydrolase [Sphingorhabdus sp. EL138]|uniref:MBL fold metallo-hydrolase n=1 Tax=Sphingorhabdus sp. EL138 TaxID=2073156 RepID=UPI0013A56487|nr:MBL fold metallo-hydrolase [Sphingorhabdus sp. EL138]